LAERFAVLIGDEFAAEESDETIHSKDYIFVDSHGHQIFCMKISEDMPKFNALHRSGLLIEREISPNQNIFGDAERLHNCDAAFAS
jgi:hypothetical protein